VNTRPITTYERTILRAWAISGNVADIAAANRTDPTVLLHQLTALCSFNRGTARAAWHARAVDADTPVAHAPRPAPTLRANGRRPHRVTDGEAAARRLELRGQPLTGRESAVLDQLGAGSEIAAIAEQLHVSIGTVKGTQKTLYAKLGVRTRAAATAAAHRINGVTPTGGLIAVTDRERQVLQHLAAGRTNMGIAAKLGISDATARTHVATLARKLDTRSRGATVAEAIRRGLIDVGSVTA
jgi:DNA-binding NarL/FixJ family response regulator